MVITPATHNGLTPSPVQPARNIATTFVRPGIAPAKPYSYAFWAVYMHVTMPNSVAASDATPR